MSACCIGWRWRDGQAELIWLAGYVISHSTLHLQRFALRPWPQDVLNCSRSGEFSAGPLLFEYYISETG